MCGASEIGADLYITEYKIKSNTISRVLQAIKNNMLSKDIDIKLFKIPERHTTNVGIASAVTAYGRILMLPFKTNLNNLPYYTDTDSVFLPKPLLRSS